MHLPLTFHLAPLLAFGLATPWLLAWLAAVGLPIVIHLWTRQRYRETPWAAMAYLLSAIQRHTRRMRLEQWLLLAIRMLVIALLVLAMAEPFLENTVFAAVSADRTHRVLVIDASYSMAYRSGEKSCFERAKELARLCVEESRQGDAFTLVLMASPPRVVVGTPVLEPAEMIEEIDHLQLPHGTADLPATVDAVLEVVGKAREENPRLTRHEVFFLTDLGRVGWMPELSRTAAPSFLERSKQLAEAATLVVIDLGQADARNLAVTELSTGESLVTPARDARIRATVKNFGPGGCGRQRLELLVDGRSAGEAYVGDEDAGLPPASDDTAEFFYRFETPGEHDVEVRLHTAADIDGLELDNRRFLALPVKPFLRVLCINGRPSGGSYQDATDYLRLALAPEDDQAGQSLTRVEVKPESSLREVFLDRYDCIFLVNVSQFLPAEAQVLHSYLAQGGGLVFFLGENVNVDNYNDVLAGGGPDNVRLLPARLGAVHSDGPFHFDPLDYRHPIVDAFRGREGAGLLTTPVSKYIQLELPKQSNGTKALAFTGGDPAIVAEQIDRGRVAVVATSADLSWTPMPLYPSFVPIVQELLAYAIGGQLQQRNYLVGQTLTAVASTPTADVTVQLDTPGGRSEKIRLRPQGDFSSWSFSETSTSGIYTARLDQPDSPAELFAVNCDTVESDLARLAVDELRTRVWPGVPFETSREAPDEEPALRIGRRATLAKELLYVVLGLLFVETYLARQFGHHTT